MIDHQHKLIIVEGLTGLGKSTMAHFIARQLGNNGIKTRWIHEGEIQHPTSVVVDNGLPGFMEDSIKKWDDFISQIKISDQVTVIEASFFNNLIETLFSHCLDIDEIIEFGMELQQVIEPVNPALVYLTHSDVRGALQQNFNNRGDRFKDFVIRYVENTPIARKEDWKGYTGVVKFWDSFASLTNQLFQIFRTDKISLKVSSGNWQENNRRVVEFLSLQWLPDLQISKEEADKFIGTYRIQEAESEYTIEYRGGYLETDLFMNEITKLIPERQLVFIVEKWHFEIIFDQSDAGDITSFSIAGKDVDYLKAVGLRAEKVKK